MLLEIPPYIQLMSMTRLLLKKFGFNKRTDEYNFFIFIVFRLKTKLIKIRSSRDPTTERGESCSLWNQNLLT